MPELLIAARSILAATFALRNQPAYSQAKAVELTSDTVGVTKVVDQLTLQPPPTTTPAETKPEATP